MDDLEDIDDGDMLDPEFGSELGEHEESFFEDAIEYNSLENYDNGDTDIEQLVSDSEDWKDTTDFLFPFITTLSMGDTSFDTGSF